MLSRREFRESKRLLKTKKPSQHSNNIRIQWGSDQAQVNELLGFGRQESTAYCSYYTVKTITVLEKPRPTKADGITFTPSQYMRCDHKDRSDWPTIPDSHQHGFSSLLFDHVDFLTQIDVVSGSFIVR